VTLPGVVQAALRHHPDLAAGEYAYANRLADALETTTRDNPEVQLDLVQAEGGGATAASLEITQLLKVSSFRSRPAYAAALRAQADAEQKAAVLTVLNTVTAQYSQAWLLQEREQYLKTLIDTATRIAKVAKAASNRGELAASELSLLEAQNAELEQEILRLQTDRESLMDELERLTQLQDISRFAAPEETPIPGDITVILNTASRAVNAQSILQRQLSAANARLRVAREDAAYPEFAPRLLWDRTFDDQEDALGIGVAVRVPLWNRNDAEVARARAEVAASRTALDRLSLDAQLIARHKRALALAQQADAYRRDILPRYQHSFELTERMWQSGQTGLLPLWQIQRDMLTVHEKALAISAEALTARLDLEAAMGAKIEEIQ